MCAEMKVFMINNFFRLHYDKSAHKGCLHTTFKRISCIFLSAMLVFTSLPSMASAAGNDISEISFSGLYSSDEQSCKTPSGDVLTEAYKISEGDIPKDIISLDNSSAVMSISDYSMNFVTFSTYSGTDSTEKRYGYSTLSDAQKQYYSKCVAVISVFMNGDYSTKDYTSEASGKTICAVAEAGFSEFGLSLSDAAHVFWTVKHDYPEWYWTYYGYSYSSSAIYFLLPSEYYTPEARKAADEYIENGLNEYTQLVSGISDTYEIVRTIHDKLISSVEYAYDSKGNPESSFWAHSMIGAFDPAHYEVVCEGYSKAFQFILNNLGIDNVYMVGDAGGAHAWNGVSIDGTYYYVDTTWDDAGAGTPDGISYRYFCIPAAEFEKSHTVYSSASSSNAWLYAIPEMGNDENATYYTRYKTDLRNITSADDAASMLNAAATLVPGEYIHILFSANGANYIAQAINSAFSYSSCPLGNTARIFAAPYKVKNPAVSISLDKDTITIDRDAADASAVTLTASLTSGSGECDDVVIWSSSSNCITIKHSGNTAVITAVRNGTAIITAAAAIGGVQAVCEVTVTGKSDSYNIYLDSTFSDVPSDTDLTVWVNGGNVGLTKSEKYNYKARTLYTDIKASNIVTVNSKGKTVTKKGRLVIGVTLSSEEPAVVNNKITDAEAALIAKASINPKTGKITVTAKSKPGTVYLWIIDTGDNHSSAYAKITVDAAPAKLILNDAPYTSADREQLKKATLSLGSSASIYIEPLISTKKSNTAAAPDGSYRISYSKDGEKYIKVSPISGYEGGYTVTAIGLPADKAGKAVTVKVTFICNENNKKTTLSITVVNPVMSFSVGTGGAITVGASGTDFISAYSENSPVTASLPLQTILADNAYTTTDKVKVYKIASPEGYNVNANGKVSTVKASGASAKIAVKIASDKKNLNISIPKKTPAGTTLYFLVVYNMNCMKVFSVTVE